MRIMIDKTIENNCTSVTSQLNGYRSNGVMEGTSPRFTIIHNRKKMRVRFKNRKVPKDLVKNFARASAHFSSNSVYDSRLLSKKLGIWILPRTGGGVCLNCSF